MNDAYRSGGSRSAWPRTVLVLHMGLSFELHANYVATSICAPWEIAAGVDDYLIFQALFTRLGARVTTQDDVESRLQTKIWQTAGARFNAARRLETRERLSVASIAGLSVVGIAISLVPSVIGAPAGSRQQGLYAFLGVAIGLSVLVISLIDGAGRFASKSEKLHDNARDLSALLNKLELLLTDPNHTIGEVEHIRQDYERLVRECPFNHTPADHNRFLAQHRLAPEFRNHEGKPRLSWPKGSFHIAFWVLCSTWIFVVTWLSVLFLAVTLFTELDMSSDGLQATERCVRHRAYDSTEAF